MNTQDAFTASDGNETFAERGVISPEMVPENEYNESIFINRISSLVRKRPEETPREKASLSLARLV